MTWEENPTETASKAWAVAIAATICLLLVAVPIGLGLLHHQKDAPTTVSAKAQVVSALDATTGPGSFHIAYRSWESPPQTPSTSDPGACGVQPPPSSSVGTSDNSPATRPVLGAPCPARNAPPRLSGTGTVNLRPFGIVTWSDVSNFGPVTVWSDGTNLWERGGANAGLAPGSSSGPGTSLSGFASLVEGTLGRRLGGVVMLNLASPTGQLNLARQAITEASKIGTASVDGVAVTMYEVTVDRSKSLALPDMTAEQMRTASAAFEVLRQQGYQETRIRLAIDQAGLIRQSTATVTFADGGTVSGETQFSDFGCAGRVVISTQTGLTVEPEPCAPPSSAAPPSTITPSITTAPASTTVAPSTTTPASTKIAPSTTGPASTTIAPSTTAPPSSITPSITTAPPSGSTPSSAA